MTPGLGFWGNKPDKSRIRQHYLSIKQIRSLRYMWDDISIFFLDAAFIRLVAENVGERVLSLSLMLSFEAVRV